MMVIYFVIGALILEALTFYVLDFGGMSEYFWYNFSLILVVGILVFIIPNYTAQYTTYTLILGLQTVLIYINYSLTRVYGDLLSIEMIRLIGEAGAAMTSSFVYIAVILELILVYVLIAVVGFLMLRYCKKDKNNAKQHFSIFSIIIILSTQLFGVGFSLHTRSKINAMTSILDAEYVLTDEFLMNTSLLKTSSYKKFGTYGYFTNIISNAIRNDAKTIETATLDYFNSGSIYGSEGNSSPVFGIDEGNNVIVVMMESIEWFGFGNGKYDPTFENLVYQDDQLEDYTFTPNITSLLFGENYLSDLGNTNKDDDALRAKNFFAKSKTNMSEGQGILGNYPVAQAITDIVNNGSKSTFGYSMPSVLSDKGYTTTYVHSHDISFYSRGDTHSAIGFDKVVGKNDIKDENGKHVYNDFEFDNWDAEGSFAKNAINHIVPEDRSKPFYTFYLNVSSHGAYTAEDNEFDGDALKYYYYVKYGIDDCELDKNGNYKLKDGVKNPTHTSWYARALENHPNQAEELVYYQCGVKGLDDAIGVIINKLKTTQIDASTPLEEKSLFDKTTLLFYADHNAYYDSLSHNVKKLNPNNNNTKELNVIPMFIVSPGLRQYNSTKEYENKFLINDRFCSAYDVVPTLFDLLGVKFNENLYLGHSLFRPADYVYTENGITKDMVVYYSNTGGLFGDNIYTFDLKTLVMGQDYSDETVDLFKAECSRILTKINFISFLNRYDLYRKLTNV